MIKKITLFCLSLLAISTISGQQLYSTVWDVEDARGSKLITLPGGDLLMAGSRNGNLHLSRWNGNGDTLWTREHPIAFTETFPIKSMVQLVTGEILISSDPVALVNEQGDLLSTVVMADRHIIEIGPDSLVGCGASDIEMRDLAGNLLWERPIVLPSGWGAGIHVLAATGNGVAVYSACMVPVEGQFFPWGHIYLGRYGIDGTFIDTTLIHRSMSATPAAHASTMTADGGILFLGQIGTGVMNIVRTNSAGDTLWTRGYGYGFEGGAGRGMRTIAEYPDGRIVLSGWSHEAGEDLITAIMELDQMGDIICVEYLDSLGLPVSPYMLRSDLALRPDGTVHVITTDLDAGSPSTTLYGYNNLCFTTEITNTSSEDSFNAFTTAEELIIELGSYKNTPQYSLHNSFGQMIATGRLRSSRTSIPVQQYASGVYILVLTDAQTGERQTKKVFIH